MKFCSCCGQELDLSAFYRNKNTKDGVCSLCKACSNARNSSWRAANAERTVATRKQNYALNKPQIDEANKRWRAANPEVNADIKRRWAADNPERDAARKGDWAKNNKEAVAASAAKRRTNKASAGGSFTAEEFNRLKRNTGNVCLCCGVSGDEVTLAADHVIPVAKGGTSDISNIQPLCRSCNSSKGTKSTDYRSI